MADLKPCPFCGSASVGKYIDGLGWCTRCSMESCSLSKVWTLTHYWQLRTPSPAVKALVKSLRTYIDEHAHLRGTSVQFRGVTVDLAAVEKEINTPAASADNKETT